MRAGTLTVTDTTDVENGTRVTVEAQKTPLVPERIIQRRARFRALTSTGFAEAGNDEEDLADTLQLTRVLQSQTRTDPYEYVILVNTPF